MISVELFKDLLDLFVRDGLPKLGEGVLRALNCNSASVVNVKATKQRSQQLVGHDVLQIDGRHQKFSVVYFDVAIVVDVLDQLLHFLLGHLLSRHLDCLPDFVCIQQPGLVFVDLHKLGLQV
jgi:hypothetical protein